MNVGQFKFAVNVNGNAKIEVEINGQADSYAVLLQVVLLIFIEASGYLVPIIIRFGQNRVLWGLLGGKMFLRDILI